MKKILQYSFTILLILTLGISGLSYFIFDLAQVEVRSAAKENVANGKQTEIIKIPAKTFSKQKDKDEIWYGGALYDIASYRTEGNDVYITVFHDRDEESLINDLVETVETNSTITANHSAHQFSKHKVHLNDNFKIIPRPYYSIGCFSNPAVKHVQDNLIAFCPDNSFSIIKPPPTFSVC